MNTYKNNEPRLDDEIVMAILEQVIGIAEAIDHRLVRAEERINAIGKGMINYNHKQQNK